MKHHTEGLFDPVMKFFTPELFIRFDAADDAEADRADEDWEGALQRYRSHLESLRDRMPEQVNRLSELCLHDSELLTIEQRGVPFPPLTFESVPMWIGFAILSLKRDDTITSLIYVLWDKVREHPPKGPWPFSKQKTYWLYDEVDIASPHGGMFLHRVLLSDGRVVEIPFVSAMIHRIPLQTGGTNDASRQIA